MESSVIRRSAVAGLAMLIGAGLATAPQSTQAMDFTGKTIKIVIPYGPGGTYDKYGVAFTNHLGKHIPGNPNLILQHMPGAGGAKAMNWTYNVMPKNGLNMIVPLDNSVLNQLMRPEKMRYKAEEFTWLGSSNQTNVVMVARTDSGVTKLKDLETKSLIVATSGKASTGYMIPGLLNGLFGYKIKIVQGYKGSSGSILAIEQGEAQASAYNWLAWSSKVPHWFTKEKPFGGPIAQIGVFKDPALPDSVPMISDLVTDEMDKKAVDFIKVLGLLGRGLALPPGVDKEVVATLRTAYSKMNADPAFAADLKKQGLRLIPASGEKINSVVEEAMQNASPDVVAHARKLIYGAGS